MGSATALLGKHKNQYFMLQPEKKGTLLPHQNLYALRKLVRSDPPFSWGKALSRDLL